MVKIGPYKWLDKWGNHCSSLPVWTHLGPVVVSIVYNFIMYSGFCLTLLDLFLAHLIHRIQITIAVKS